MQVLIKRRDRERHLAVNQPISLRVSKPMAASLTILAIQHGSSASELCRLFIAWRSGFSYLKLLTRK
jgi:hypothetical protein